MDDDLVDLTGDEDDSSPKQQLIAVESSLSQASSSHGFGFATLASSSFHARCSAGLSSELPSKAAKPALPVDIA